MGDVVNATKHQSLSQPTPHGPPLVASASSVEEKILLVEYSDEGGPYTWCEKIVTVSLSDGTTRDLLEIMTSVVNFWEEHLRSLGLLGDARVFRFEGPHCHRSRDQCGNSGVNLKAVQGQRLHVSYQLLRFNPDSGRAEPRKELEGAKFQLSIYKPRHEVVIRHPSDDQVEPIVVELSDEHFTRVKSLPDDRERERYLTSIPSIQEALRAFAEKVKD